MYTAELATSKVAGLKALEVGADCDSAPYHQYYFVKILWVEELELGYLCKGLGKTLQQNASKPLNPEN